MRREEKRKSTLSRGEGKKPKAHFPPNSVNPNSIMTRRHCREVGQQLIPFIPSDFTKSSPSSKGGGDDWIEIPTDDPPELMSQSPGPDGFQVEIAKQITSSNPSSVEDSSSREKLQRRRMDIAERVWIPDIWGQEGLLKDWIDCAAFDSSLVPNGIMSARQALVEDCRQIQNRC